MLCHADEEKTTTATTQIKEAPSRVIVAVRTFRMRKMCLFLSARKSKLANTKHKCRNLTAEMSQKHDQQLRCTN